MVKHCHLLWTLGFLGYGILFLIVPCACHGVHDAVVQSQKLAATDERADHRYFLQRIFEKYGHNGVITLEGFEHLLDSLGLGGLDFEDQHDVSYHKVGGRGNRTFAKMHGHDRATALGGDGAGEERPQHSASPPDMGRHQEGHTSDGADLESKPQIGFMTDGHNDEHHSADKRENNSLVNLHSERCLSPTEIMWSSQINPSHENISPNNFAHLCPVIIYELDQRRCRSADAARHDDHDHDHHDHTDSSDEPSVSYRSVWFYSSLSVLIISVTGMLSVAIVPVIQRFYYQQLLHYFVALAIGSLTGDALLHLLPHAMTSVASGGHGHSHDEGEGGHGGDHTGVWLGLTALGGICMFFTAERLLSMLASWRQKQASHELTVIADSESHERLAIGEKLSKQKHNSYGYSYGEVPGDVLQGLNEKQAGASGTENYANRRMSMLDKYSVPMVPLCSSTVLHPNSSKGQNCSLEMGNGDSNVTNGGNMIVAASHSTSHHGHSHTHAHEIPQNVSSMAWMVIAGDGLHNFSDGMAIGAAFASSLTGGMSTAIAVFCHELPHELGDFALLLKAGMGTRQALLYNGLSSFLCFIGMLVGLAIGNIDSANSWVFAGVAGTFLYIALVDMVPELNSDNGEEFSGVKKFVVQAFGMGTGITIMCLIAIYEHDLQRLFE